MKEKTNKEKILSAKPGKPKSFKLDTINLASFRQEALRINDRLRAAKTPLSNGRKTYYEVSASSKENKVTVYNHMTK